MTAIRHFAIHRFQRPLRIGMAGPIFAILEEGLHIQAFIASAQKETQQATTQNRHMHQELCLKLPEGQLGRLAKNHEVFKSFFGVSTHKFENLWTSVARWLMLTVHGANSEPRL